MPMDLDIFWPSAAVTNPCPNTALGSGNPADQSMHGQMTQWNQMISLPMMCTLAGHIPSPVGFSGQPVPVR